MTAAGKAIMAELAGCKSIAGVPKGELRH